LQAEVQTEDYREGGVNEYAHKLAGPTNYPANQSQRASPTPMPSGTGTEKSPRA
jgi:hypothetical protein